MSDDECSNEECYDGVTHALSSDHGNHGHECYRCGGDYPYPEDCDACALTASMAANAAAKAQGAAEERSAIVREIDRVVSVTRELIEWPDDHVSECSCDDCRNALIRMARVDALTALKVTIEITGDHIKQEAKPNE